MKIPRVLIIDDDESINQALAVVLADEGFDAHFATNGRDGLERAKQGDIEAVVTDLRMPGLGGMELIQTLRQLNPKIPITLITAHGSTDTAIRAMQLGAFEYLVKPYEIPELLDVLKRAVKSYRLASSAVKLGEIPTDGDAIIGDSKAMQKVYKDIGRFASKPVTVLIQGETGTGKELVARALYQYSDRVNQPFIAVNCAAIPENLLESELFGHEKGSFTGADQRRIGRFEQANHGTLFLDEIGDLPLNTQVKLLRALQEKTIQRLGSKQILKIDIRVIAATHVNLVWAMEKKAFRDDLYYRLSGIIIDLPPLRERKEDIPVISRYLVQRFIRDMELLPTTIGPDALKCLQDYDWPGNVRELENVLRKSLLECEGYSITRPSVESDLDAHKRHPAATETTVSGSSFVRGNGSFEAIAAAALDAAESGAVPDALGWVNDHLESALYSAAIKRSGGNQTKAAQWIGVSRITMREKLRKYGLLPGD